MIRSHGGPERAGEGKGQTHMPTGLDSLVGDFTRWMCMASLCLQMQEMFYFEVLFLTVGKKSLFSKAN